MLFTLTTFGLLSQLALGVSTLLFQTRTSTLLWPNFTILRLFRSCSRASRGLKIQETITVTWMCQLQVQSIKISSGLLYSVHKSLVTDINACSWNISNQLHTLCNILNSKDLSYTMVEALNLTSALHTKCLTKHNYQLTLICCICIKFTGTNMENCE